MPPLPAKKVTGKGEAVTLIERAHFLNLFLVECCEHKYIAQSAEMQVFLRPSGDIGKQLSGMQVKMKTADRIAMMRACIDVDEVCNISSVISEAI